MRDVRFGLGMIALALALVSTFAFYDRYWLWRDCFNELGRCWDSATEQVYREQAGLVWGLGVALFAVLAVALRWPRRHRARS